jgi:hypothetical protein
MTTGTNEEGRRMSDDNEQKIRVKDRRMFNPDGSLRAPLPEPPPEAERVPEAAAAAATKDNVVSMGARERAPEKAPEPAAVEQEPEAQRPGQPSLFGDLVHSLAYQAAMFMGLVRDPLGPQYPTDLRAAKQSIDMLRMLKDKTRGNLTPDEATTLERILTDLQMQYVAISRGKGKV